MYLKSNINYAFCASRLVDVQKENPNHNHSANCVRYY